MNQPATEQTEAIEPAESIVSSKWCGRSYTFEAIRFQFGLSEAEVILLMKREMTLKNWKNGKRGKVVTKHQAKRSDVVSRFRCSRQRSISGNRISKRGYCV